MRPARPPVVMVVMVFDEEIFVVGIEVGVEAEFGDGEVFEGEFSFEGGGVFFVGLFAEVHPDFVGVHFGFALGFGLGTFFFGAGDFETFGADLGGLFA